MCAEYMCMLQDSVYCPKCSREHSFGSFRRSLRLHFWSAYIFEAVTGGKGVVQLKIGSAKNQTITGSDQHQRTRPLATTPQRQPTLAAPAPAPAPAPAAAPAAAEAECAALEAEPAAAAAAVPCSPARKGKQRAGKGGG